MTRHLSVAPGSLRTFPHGDCVCAEYVATTGSFQLGIDDLNFIILLSNFNASKRLTRFIRQLGLREAISCHCAVPISGNSFEGRRSDHLEPGQVELSGSNNGEPAIKRGIFDGLRWPHPSIGRADG